MRRCRASALSRLPCRSGLLSERCCPLCRLPDVPRPFPELGVWPRSSRGAPSGGGAVRSSRLRPRTTLPCVCRAGADFRDALARAAGLSRGMGIPLNGDKECCCDGGAGADALLPRTFFAGFRFEPPFKLGV